LKIPYFKRLCLIHLQDDDKNDKCRLIANSF
jgi:hypothetical protein